MRKTLIVISFLLVFGSIFFVGIYLEQKSTPPNSSKNEPVQATSDSEDYISPPDFISFELTGTLLAGNDNLSAASRKHSSLNISEEKKTIEIRIESMTGVFRFYWKNYKIEHINTDGTVKTGITYIGHDESGEYTEVEFFYTQQRKVASVVVRANSNQRATVLLNKN